MSSPGKIYLLATPIGNLSDISARAKDVLSSCDAVACEDTRVTGKLLSALGINTKLERLDENTIRKKSDEIIDSAKHGDNIVFCSDAGMPCISDPGSYLVSCAHKSGVSVTIIPGPSAVESAYALSGFESTEYHFKGFLPKKSSERMKVLADILSRSYPTVIYDSPKRITKTISEIATLNQNRRVFCIKEITKVHETYYLGSACDVYRQLSDLCSSKLKGEWAIVVDGISDDELLKVRDDKLSLARMYAIDKKEAGVCSTDIKNDLIKYFNVTKNTAFELATFS